MIGDKDNTMGALENGKKRGVKFDPSNISTANDLDPNNFSMFKANMTT